MNGNLMLRRTLKWTALAIALLIVLFAGVLAAVDAGYGRGLLVRYVAWRVNRPVQVQGRLEAQLFSLNPRVTAERVTVGNPPWTPPGVTVEIGKLSVAIRLPGLRHTAGITELTMEAATLTLLRDAGGRANWQLVDPAHKKANRNSPIVRSLSMPDAHVTLDDAKRHLQFTGTVSATDPAGTDNPQPLAIKGAGQLNGRSVTFNLTADPLATASHSSPYHFRFVERSSGSQVQGSGVLPQPFVYDTLDATFTASGPDLKDLFFLTGVHLIDTGEYRLSGTLLRRDTRTIFNDLAVTSGSSDVSGTVASDSSSGRPTFDVDLNSRLLRLSDLGIRAAGRTTAPKSPLILSDAMISPNVIHAEGAEIKYHAQRVEVGRIPFEKVALQGRIGHDVFAIAPLSATLAGGRLVVRASLDGTKPAPHAKLDLRLTDLHVDELPRKTAGPAPLAGLLEARIDITGLGRSLHQIAASANGTVTAQMRQGELRDSFAEMSGVDLRGLGLLVAKNKQTVSVACAMANFAARDGTFTVQNLIADTAPVVIVGDGQIHFDSEALDLSMRGTPKGVRLLRLRAPVLVQGTLANPRFHIELAHSKFMLADRGPATTSDCTTKTSAQR